MKQDRAGSKAIRNGQTRCNLKVESTGHTLIWKRHIRQRDKQEKLQDCWPEQLKKQLWLTEMEKATGQEGWESGQKSHP